MKKKTIILLCLLLNLFAFSQKDSIIIDAKISAGTLTVREKIYYQNTSEIELTHLKLQNFTAAYKSRNTPLVRRKLEDRKKDLYYAKSNERGRLVYLMINKKPYEGVLDNENLFIKLPKPLAPNAFTELSLEYSVIFHFQCQPTHIHLQPVCNRREFSSRIGRCHIASDSSLFRSGCRTSVR
jgi:hypothetical protein